MKTIVLGLLLTLFAAACLAEVGRKCTEKSQCAEDECCQIINIVVASRKRQLHPLGGPNTSGTCEKYRREGDHCNSFDVMNGYCGCAQGLTCKTVHVSTTPAPIMAVLAPRKMAPGYVSFCSAN